MVVLPTSESQHLASWGVLSIGSQRPLHTLLLLAVAGTALRAQNSARLALGAVAPTARQVEQVSQILLGRRLDEAILQELSEAARRVCDPIDDKRGTIEFRTHVAGVLAKRVIKTAWLRAEAR